MKLIYIVTILVLSNYSVGYSQTDFKDVYEASKDIEGISQKNIPYWLIGWMVSDENTELKEALKNLENISLITSEHCDNGFQELTQFVKNKDYKDLMIVKNDETHFSFKIKETKKGIKELVMTSINKGNLTIICLKGLFKEKDLSTLKTFVKVQM